MKREPCSVLVLAAGQGKRMRSKRVKLLHEVAGRPMIVHVLEAARRLRPSRVITVIGHQAQEVRKAVGDLSDHFVVQRERRGTGHAVLLAGRLLAAGGAPPTVLILNGDVPAIRTGTLRSFVSRHRRLGASLSVLTGPVPDPAGYGRIVRDGRGRIERIVEDRDATRTEREIREINSGIYCATVSELLPALRRLRPDNVQGENYLTDAVRELISRGKKVAAVLHEDAGEILGVNDRAELADASKRLYARKASELLESGVTLLDPDRTWVDPRAKIGRDSVLYPDVIVEGATVIGERCVVRPGCRLVDAVLGDGAEVRDHSVITQSRVGKGATVGPFAHLRPGSELGPEVKVGNFVEVKKSVLGQGTKASHLTYLGDAEIGAGSNIGAGTITCNYDGEVKHRTKLGRRVFIGSGVQLVAPVTLADGAYVGAGTTVTEDVPSEALALSRVPQANIEGWVARRKRKKRATRPRAPRK